MPLAFKLPQYNSSFNSRVGLTLSGPRDHVHAMQLSLDGKYLALGNDGGNLEIRNTEPGWERTRIYKVRAKVLVRAICWHPSEERTLFFGCANGNIYRLNFQIKKADKIASGKVNGFVHALAMNAETNQLAVAFAHSIVVIDKPFSMADELGNLKYLRMPGSQTGTTSYTLPKNLYYLSAGVLLAVFFGDIGIIAYSTKSGEQLWKMDIVGSWAGSSALSPSGEHLVVADLMRGVDWYSLSHKRFMMTTHYAPSEEPYKHNMVVGIAFLDENTAVVGHNCGKIIFCPYGMAQNPPVLRLANGYQAIQTLCCGIVNGAMQVLAMIPIDEEDEQQSRIEAAPQIAVVCFQNESRLPEREKGYPKKTTQREFRGDKWSILAGQLMLASVVVLVGLRQWPRVTFVPRQPERTEQLQLSHELCARQPIIRTSTITETMMTTEITTAMETATATETYIVKDTATATETVTERNSATETTTVVETIMATVPASPDCVCTIVSVLGDPLNVQVGESVGEEVDEEVDEDVRELHSL